MKRTIFFITTSILAVIMIIVLFLYFTISSQQTSPSRNPSITQPTAVPVEKNGSKNTAPVEYNGQKSTELLNKLKTRDALSETGQAAKQKLKNQLNSSSGTLFSSKNVSVGYLSSSDQFQAEIKSINISQAKQDAVNWMVSQGFTKDDVCKLPLSFYLDLQVSEALRGTGFIFSPLPDGC